MDLEQIRKKAISNKSRNRKFYILFWVFLALGIIFVFSRIIPVMITLFALSILFLIIAIVNSISKKSQLSNEIYHNYIYPKLHEAFDDLKMNSLEGINRDIIRNLGFIDTGDRIETSNTMEGFYRGVSFVSCGVRCTETHRDSDGDLDTEVTFSGRLVMIGASLLDSDGFVDILDKTMHYKRFRLRTRKVTINHPAESMYDIFVDSQGQSLPQKVLDYLVEIKKLHPSCEFYFRFTNDRVYMLIENASVVPYTLPWNLDDIDEEKVDFIIKKDSSFITNTISLILDK